MTMPATTSPIAALFVHAQLQKATRYSFRVSLFIQSITIYLIRQNAKKLVASNATGN